MEYFCSINLWKILSPDRDFIASRQASLQRYVETILQHPMIRTDQAVRKFFDPQNYSQNFQGDYTHMTFFADERSPMRLLSTTKRPQGLEGDNLRWSNWNKSAPKH